MARIGPDWLESVDRILVSLVGERGALRVVKTEACVPFSDTLPEGEDLSAHTRDIRNQLDEAMNVTRRVVRGQQKKLNKAKKSGGELLAVNELFDRAPTKVKNLNVFCICLCFVYLFTVWPYLFVFV